MRVVIAEDQVLLREGLARLFADGGHEVAAAVGDAQALLPAVSAHAPDLVVVDIRMPPTFTDEGARAARLLKQTHPTLGVLVLSQHIETIHSVALITRGGSALDPHVVASLLTRRENVDPLAALTERERTILELMAQGLTNTAISKRLHLSERTVEAHVRHLFDKLNLPPDQDAHRRVLAVLTHLGATPNT